MPDVDAWWIHSREYCKPSVQWTFRIRREIKAFRAWSRAHLHRLHSSLLELRLPLRDFASGRWCRDLRKEDQTSPITVGALSKAWTVFARSNTWIVSSNPTWGMDVCVRLFCVCCCLATRTCQPSSCPDMVAVFKESLLSNGSIRHSMIV
jgi:hypothetical protein